MVPFFFDCLVTRIYGFEKEPYRFLEFIITLIFAYEVLRQRLNVNDFHFVSPPKKTLFSFPYAIFSLITSKTIIDVMQREMSSFGLVHGMCYKYDPLGIISNLNKYVGLYAYVHEPRL